MSTAKLDDSTQRPLYGERIIGESKIICFENPNKKRIYEISIHLPEFTCKCPFSGYPDFAKLNIIYQPNLKVYELKSLKLYINNFRDIKISHEEVVNFLQKLLLYYLTKVPTDHSQSVFEAITFQLQFLVEGIYLSCYQ